MANSVDRLPDQISLDLVTGTFSLDFLTTFISSQAIFRDCAERMLLSTQKYWSTINRAEKTFWTNNRKKLTN